MEKHKDSVPSLAILIWAASILNMFLTSHHFLMTVMILVFLVVYLLMSWLEKEDSRLKVRRSAAGAILCLISLIWMILRSYYVFLLLSAGCMLLGAVEGIGWLIRHKGVWKRSFLDEKGAWCLRLFVMLLCSALGLSLLYISVNPDLYVSARSKDQTASATEASIEIFDEHYIRYNDERYDEEYPDSTFDVYAPKVSADELLPVFIYLHGGDYASMDKKPETDDPQLSGTYKLFEKMIDAGYIVVSVNYAQAPEYKYPVPLLQMAELCSYLKEHGSEYGIDASRMIFGGSTSGAQIAGQFVLTQIDESYALECGIPVVTEPGEILAVYLACGILQPEYTSESDFLLYDFKLYQYVRSYFGCMGLENSTEAKQADLVEHVTAEYPPVFITDGNTMTYHLQAHRLEERLQELGVSCDSMILDSVNNDKDTIMHGFDTGIDSYANGAITNFVQFLTEQGLAAGN